MIRKATVVLVSLACALAVGCDEGPRKALAKRITARHELIGGKRALGEVGDWLLQNDRIRVIIQDEGFSRGFGVFGGSLIDADIVRPTTAAGESHGGTGNDMFGEMFPAFFLEALEPVEVRDPNDSTKKLPPIEIENDGANGEPAVLVVRGVGNDFLALTQLVNETVLGDSRESPNLFFETRYIVEAGKPYVRIETRVQNINFEGNTLNWDGAEALLGAPVPTPFGDVMLFGAGNKVFVPHEAGYDLRFSLEKIYADGQYELPALPGIAAEFVASTGPGVSYGVLAAPVEDTARNYVFSTGQFEGATDHSVHIPFIASAFTGLFQVVPPPLEGNDKAPGGPDEFTFTRYFIIGTGDVASISDVVYDILGADTGVLTGELFEDGTRTPVPGAHVIVHDTTGKKVTECTVDDDGRYRATLRPGTYRLRAVVEGRRITPFTEVVVEKDAQTFQRLVVDAPAMVSVTVIEPGRGPIPAKASLVGTIDVGNAGLDTRDYLFDLSLGEHWRYTDMVPDTEDPATRRFIETFGYTEDGTVHLEGRPGRYDVVVSRGLEYSRESRSVVLEPGKTVNLVIELHRVVDTAGYVGGDFHLHSRLSLDSSAGLHDRILSYAGEGMELAVSTDHNFVVDYQPIIAELGLERFLTSMVGLELTTIDRGHFNGYPLEIRPGALARDGDGSGAYTNTIQTRTLGSFQWAKKTPDEVFAALRALGRREPATMQCAIDNALAFLPALFAGTADLRDDPFNPKSCRTTTKPVIVQVNHPRDSILGYFDQYGLSQDDLSTTNPGGLFSPNTEYHPEFDASHFAWDFDALEIYNGKRFELLHTFRVPSGEDIDPVTCCPVVEGMVYREFKKGPDCDPELEDCTCTPAITAQQIADGNCEEREIAYPGAFEDWVKILRSGRRVAGMANSDSHEPEKEEPGYPRSYVKVASDEPFAVTADEIVAGIQALDVLQTNGPFVRATVDGKGMGQLAPASSGAFEVAVHVESAPWVVVDHVRVYVDEDIVLDEPVSPTLTGEGPRARFVLDVTYPLTATADALVIVEAYGRESLFPTVYPNEIPPLQFTDVLAAFGSTFGGAAVEGELKPQLVFQTTPLAITNPIFIDVDGDGEYTPALTIPTPGTTVEARTAGVTTAPFAPGAMEELHYRDSVLKKWKSLPRRQQLTLARLPVWLWPSDRPTDVRRIFFQFAPHAH